MSRATSHLNSALWTEDHLFYIVDIRLPEHERKQVEVVGTQIEGFIRNGHYIISYSRENVRKRDGVPGGFEVTLKTHQQEHDELLAEIERLKAERASLEAPAKPSSKTVKQKPETEEPTE